MQEKRLRDHLSCEMCWRENVRRCLTDMDDKDVYSHNTWRLKRSGFCGNTSD